MKKYNKVNISKGLERTNIKHKEQQPNMVKTAIIKKIINSNYKEKSIKKEKNIKYLTSQI